MLKSNVSLAETLRTLGQQTDSRALRDRIFKMVEKVEGGTTLSDALSLFPSVFSPFYISMVKSGEASGKLTDVFICFIVYRLLKPNIL